MDDQFTQWSQHVPAWLWNIGILAIALLTGFLIKAVITALLRFHKRDTGYSFFYSLLKHTGPALNHFLPILTLNMLISFMHLGGDNLAYLSRIAAILLTISLAALLVSSIQVFEDYVYHIYDLEKSDNLKERKVRTQLQFIRRVLVSLIILIALAIVLLSFDSVRKIGAGLLTGVGIGGIIVGLPLKNLWVISWPASKSLLPNPYELVVEGEWGKVEDISFTYVVLSIWDQRRLILPITYFIEKPFQNWTRSTAEILGPVFLYVDYTLPVDELRTELTRLLNESPLWDKRVGILQVTDSKGNGTMELRALVSAANSSDAFDLRCYIRENLLKYVQQQHITALPQKRIILKKTVICKPLFNTLRGC
ncbi:mechanosensitive ion channel family protein [Mucilaginibacter sp. UYCu711]|uniref:mechanosensitive ion channel family protein n=1 Tax=Mucilaginibacter sp. UYCu711 TaxID=3156339 RepID=UPI003D1E7860